MCRYRERPSGGRPEDLEVGLGGYDASVAHDFGVCLHTTGGESSPAAKDSGSEDAGENSTPDLEDGLVSNDDRRISFVLLLLGLLRKAFMISRRSRGYESYDPETEQPNARAGGFDIVLDELAKLVRDRNLEALNQYNGVEGLSVLLKTDLEKGIDGQNNDLLQRRQIFGSNKFPCNKGKSFLRFIWKATQFPPSLVITLAVVIKSLLRIKRKDIHDGWYEEGGIVLCVVLHIIVRAITEYWQSRQFRNFSEVIRGGENVWVSIYDIVVGDIVPLKTGRLVPADGLLLDANSLKVDEHEITGSHDIVQIDVNKFIFSGSKLIEGNGKMLVTSVGMNTKWGIPHATDEEKPFQVYVRWIALSASLLVVLLTSVACIVVLCRYFYGRTNGNVKFIRGSTTADEATEFVIKSLSFGIATIVLGVPVGLSIAVLLILASTRRKMKTDNALVQTLSACERMGYVTKILCHRTGISTLNQDPGRHARQHIQLCISAGVKVCMVTDDDVSTATDTAKEFGIFDNASGRNIMKGADFRDLSNLERKERAKDLLVIAESCPRDGLLFVEALKESGDVVATGMGIHDPETLLAADVTLAMGIGGTAEAKENSDIIILDDDFATVVKVIRWSRYLYTNIQRYVLFRLTVSVSLVAICVVEVVRYDEFPLNVVQLLLLNLIIDIFGALALAYRPTGHHLMINPPVGIRDPLITKTMWSKLVLQVIYVVLFLAVINSGKLLVLMHGHTSNVDKVKNTFIFTSFVFCMGFSEFKIGSLKGSFKEFIGDNMFLITMASTIILQIIVLEFLVLFTSADRLDWKKWLLTSLVGLVSILSKPFSITAINTVFGR